MSDLEDLLQNRLPIDLCEAQSCLCELHCLELLTGPRRLRIDAAHKTVPPPHVNLTADKRREQQSDSDFRISAESSCCGLHWRPGSRTSLFAGTD
jgi:hypothetical protein